MTCILKFHPSSDKHFESDMSIDGLKVLAIYLLTGYVGLVTVTCYQMVVTSANLNLG
jgi:hypothetical protein